MCEVHVELSAVTVPSVLTLTAALVGGQLITWVAGALVAAQSVDTALLTATVIRLGALVHLYKHNDVLVRGPFAGLPAQWPTRAALQNSTRVAQRGSHR